MSTWEVLLNAAQIRNYESILRISNTTEIPAGVRYHRQCYQIFTMISLLERVKKQSEKNMESLREIIEQSESFETDESKPKRSSSNSILLPDKCIFCDKDLKYKKRKPEQLRKCEVKR